MPNKIAVMLDGGHVRVHARERREDLRPNVYRKDWAGVRFGRRDHSPDHALRLCSIQWHRYPSGLWAEDDVHGRRCVAQDAINNNQVHLALRAIRSSNCNLPSPVQLSRSEWAANDVWNAPGASERRFPAPSPSPTVCQSSVGKTRAPQLKDLVVEDPSGPVWRSPR
jgi:hypothetical protein